MLGSPRFRTDAAATDALVKYSQTTPNPDLVVAYNRAVRAYEDTRTGALAQPVARVFGFDARPVLALDESGDANAA